MTSRPSPQALPYRITLFYGPEPVPEPPPRIHCVFNVKKRSWKAGVQIAVALEEAQLQRLRAVLAVDAWFSEVLRTVQVEARAEYACRAEDALAQRLCALKLSLALDTGVQQVSGVLPADWLVDELDRAVVDHEADIKSDILRELDLVHDQAP